MSPPDRCQVLVLAGGAGTRIRSLYPDIPKPLIPVAGRPFLLWILSSWARLGISRFSVSLGFRSDVAAEILARTTLPDCDVSPIIEPQPLGTGGAARFAAHHMEGRERDFVIVVNGDSLLFAELSRLWPVLAQPNIDAALVGLEVEDASRFGTLRVDENHRLIGFDEKKPGRAMINAGIYCLRLGALRSLSNAVPLSMEYDVFPALIDSGAAIQVVPLQGDFLDIGTPESIKMADDFVLRNMRDMNL